MGVLRQRCDAKTSGRTRLGHSPLRPRRQGPDAPVCGMPGAGLIAGHHTTPRVLDDLPALTSIYKPLRRPTRRSLFDLQPFEPERPARRGFDDHSSSGRHRLLVAIDPDGSLLGYATTSRWAAEGPRTTTTVESSVYCRPDVRGAGPSAARVYSALPFESDPPVEDIHRIVRGHQPGRIPHRVAPATGVWGFREVGVFFECRPKVRPGYWDVALVRNAPLRSVDGEPKSIPLVRLGRGVAGARESLAVCFSFLSTRPMTSPAIAPDDRANQLGREMSLPRSRIGSPRESERGPESVSLREARPGAEYQDQRGRNNQGGDQPRPANAPANMEKQSGFFISVPPAISAMVRGGLLPHPSAIVPARKSGRWFVYFRSNVNASTTGGARFRSAVREVV